MGAPSFFWKGWGQNRAKGRHLTGTNMLSTFSGFNQRGGGGGGDVAVCFWPIQPAGVRGGGVLSAFWLVQPAGEGGGGGTVHFRLIQPAEWGCCLSAFG